MDDGPTMTEGIQAEIEVRHGLRTVELLFWYLGLEHDPVVARQELARVRRLAAKARPDRLRRDCGG